MTWPTAEEIEANLGSAEAQENAARHRDEQRDQDK